MDIIHSAEEVTYFDSYLNNINKNSIFKEKESLENSFKKRTKESTFKDCPFNKLCKYCNYHFYHNCCLIYTLKSNNFPRKCKFVECFNYSLCNKAVKEKISEYKIPNLDVLKNLRYQVRNPEYRLEKSYIPKIDIDSPKFRSEQIKIINSCKLDIINISLQKMMASAQSELIREIFLSDLHEILDFRGRILLTSNISDHFCEKIMQNIPQFIEQVNSMKVDIMTTLDANFYWNQPIFITLLKMEQITRANRLINDIDCSQIGLVPPMVPFFTQRYLKFMLESNFKIIGIPMQEINKDNKKRIKSKIFHLVNSHKKFHKFKLLLISTSPIKVKKPTDLIYPDYYTSLSWTIIKNSNSLSNEVISHKRKDKLLYYNELIRTNKEIANIYKKWW